MTKMPAQPQPSGTIQRALRAPALALAAVLMLGVGSASVAEANVTCAYTGPPANTLTVEVTDNDDVGEIGVIERRGPNIAVGGFLEAPQQCAGGTPTVLNTDTIVVQSKDLGSSVDLRLGGGPLAPGATAETEGASEIEIHAAGELLIDVIGTSAGDELQWGPGGAHAGLNLNPDSNNDRDVDVTISEDTILVADGAGGDDEITAQPGALIRDGIFSVGGSGQDLLRAPDTTYAILDGGPGDDLIIGSKYSDRIYAGGGNDRVRGRGGADRIDGGRGRDRLYGGAGPDKINSRDSQRDTVSCGSGRDRVRADRRDRVRGCETRR